LSKRGRQDSPWRILALEATTAAGSPGRLSENWTWSFLPAIASTVRITSNTEYPRSYPQLKTSEVPPPAQIIKGRKVSLGKVCYVNVVPDAGPIVRRVVVSENSNFALF
jgi:hypothetical protein